MPDLIYEKRDHYAIFTMNRPERLNALGGSMQTELTAALDDFHARPGDARRDRHGSGAGLQCWRGPEGDE